MRMPVRDDVSGRISSHIRVYNALASANRSFRGRGAGRVVRCAVHNLRQFPDRCAPRMP